MSERSMRESLILQLFLALAEDRPRRRTARDRAAIHGRRQATAARRPRRAGRPA